MTNDTSYRQKGRAVFLAAIMVLSMVAGAAVLAGSATASHNSGSAEYTMDELDGSWVWAGQTVNITDAAEGEVQVEYSDGFEELTAGANGVEIDTSGHSAGEVVVTDTGDGNATFEIQEQNINTFEFADDSVAPDQTVDLDIESNRANYNVSVSADGLDSEDLANIFDAAEDDGEHFENSDSVLLEGETTHTADFADIDPGNYTFEAEVVDTGANASTNITVDEEDATDGEFNQGTYNQEVGDIVDFGFDTTNVDADDAHVQIEDEHGVFNVTLDVDEYEDDSANLTMNTFLAQYNGDADNNVSGDLFGGEDAASVNVVADQMSEDLDQPLNPSRVDIRLYDGNPVTEDAEQLDRGIIRLQERSLDSATTYSAPSSIDPSEVSPSDLTERSETTEGDYVVTEFQGTGLYGYLTDENGFNASNGLALNINDTAEPPYGTAGTLAVDGDTTGVNVVEDPENDTFYVVVDPASLNTTEGDAPEHGDTWETAFTVGTDNPYVSDDAESVNATWDYTERTLEFDHEQNEDDAYLVAGGSNAEISGTSSLLPGTEVSLSSFFATEILDSSTEVGENGEWSAELDLSDYESGNQFTMEAVEDGTSESTGEVDAVISDANGSVPASFSVDASLSSDSVTVGDSATLEYTISNTGDEAGETNYTVTVDGEEVDSGTADLEAGNSTETMSYEDFDTSSAGDISWEVSTGDDSVTGTLTVNDEGGNDTGGTDTGTDTGNDSDGDSDDDGGQPGFGLIVALFALIGAALLALRRQN